MFLSNIIDVINPKEIRSFKKKQIVEYITANSKLIKKNSIYVANFNKNIKKTFVHEAIKKGAIAILTNKRIQDITVPYFIVKICL